MNKYLLYNLIKRNLDKNAIIGLVNNFEKDEISLFDIKNKSNSNYNIYSKINRIV